MKRLIAVAALVALASPMAAQTVVTPGNLHGWSLYDGGSAGTDPSAISGINPFAGNGSLAMNITTSGQQPAAFFAFANPFLLSDFATNPADNFGFRFLSDASQVSPPTIRLFLSGLDNTGALKTTGSIGWFGTAAPGWQTESFTGAAGNFFLRVTSAGQIDETTCGNTTAAGSFDDRRQTIDQWLSTCNGVGSAIDLSNATVSGLEIDYGTFPGFSGSTTDYADLPNFSVTSGNQQGNFNFELSTATPEPSSIVLLATGLVGLAGYARRRRTRRS
jgi:hypothetical protein